MARSQNDQEELETFKRFVAERAAHRSLEQVVGKRLPFSTVTVPQGWWDKDRSKED